MAMMHLLKLLPPELQDAPPGLVICLVLEAKPYLMRVLVDLSAALEEHLKLLSSGRRGSEPPIPF